jgi:hypothetical protein
LSFVSLFNLFFMRLSRSYDQVMYLASWLKWTRVGFFILFIYFNFVLQHFIRYELRFEIFFILFSTELSRSYLIFVLSSNIGKIYFYNIDKHLFFELIIVYIFLVWFIYYSCFFNYIIKLFMLIELIWVNDPSLEIFLLLKTCQHCLNISFMLKKNYPVRFAAHQYSHY